MLKNIMRKRNEGFTLVELMIVVAIIGVLAALAIYGVARYLKHAKTAEATRSLGSMENGSKNKYQIETDTDGGGTTFVHVFCPSATAAVPASVPAGSKVKVLATDWDTTVWQCLKFSMNEPQFYSYNYASANSGTSAVYTATATGDLDGNTVVSTFQLTGQGSITGDASRTNLLITNEDE